MTANRRGVLKGVGAVTAGAVASPFFGPIGPTLAAWPDRPVRIVVPNTPGGPSDILARILAPAMQEALGGSFIIENKGGGGGNIGINFVARAEPDGYTLLLCTSVIAVNPGLYGDKLPYDPLTDFSPIAELSTTPNIFTIDAKLGINTMPELIAAAKKEPEKFNVSVPPVSTTATIGVELLKLIEGLKIGVVVHAGGGQAMQSLLSRAVQFSAGSLTPAKPHIEAGTIKAIAVMGNRRSPDMPNVPTMIELGYKDFNLDTFLALFGPAKMTAELVQKLTKAASDGFNRPDIRATLVKSAFEVDVKGPAGLAARMAREVPMFKTIIGKSGIKLSDKG